MKITPSGGIELSVRVAIVGCGLIGQKRAKALAGAKLTVCCDLKLPLAEKLAAGSVDVEGAGCGIGCHG